MPELPESPDSPQSSAESSDTVADSAGVEVPAAREATTRAATQHRNLLLSVVVLPLLAIVFVGMLSQPTTSDPSGNPLAATATAGPLFTPGLQHNAPQITTMTASAAQTASGGHGTRSQPTPTTAPATATPASQSPTPDPTVTPTPGIFNG